MKRKITSPSTQEILDELKKRIERLGFPETLFTTKKG